MYSLMDWCDVCPAPGCEERGERPLPEKLCGELVRHHPGAVFQEEALTGQSPALQPHCSTHYFTRSLVSPQPFTHTSAHITLHTHWSVPSTPATLQHTLLYTLLINTVTDSATHLTDLNGCGCLGQSCCMSRSILC